MSKLRQSIPARQARAGMRPGSTTQPRTTTAPAPAQAQQQDKRLAQIVEQGGVGVWKVKGSGTPIYALSRDQAQAEAQRRGVKGALSLEGYVKLSDADRERLQQFTKREIRQPQESGRPRDLEDIRRRTEAKETERRARTGKESYTLGTPTSEPKASDSAFSAEDRAFIESRGGVIGVISESEAAKMEATSTSNAMQYKQPAGTKPHQVVTETERNLSKIVEDGGVGIWHVYDENTKTSYKVEAVDRKQAERIAKREGMKPSNIYAFTSRDISDAERKEILTYLGQCGRSKADPDDFEMLVRLGVIDKDVEYKRGKIDLEQRAQLALAGMKVNDKLMGKLGRYYMPEHEAYDIINAIRGGITDDEFREAGFDMDKIAQAREWAQLNEEALKALEPYQTAPGEYDVLAAAKWVPRDKLKAAGFDDEALARLAQVLDENDAYHTTLMKYRSDEGYDLVGAYQDGVSRDFLVNVGFDKDKVYAIADHIDAAKFLGDSRGDTIKRIQTGCYGGSCTLTPDEDDVTLEGGGHCRKEKYETLPAHLQTELNKLGMDGFEEKYLGTGQTTRDVLKDTGLSMIPIYGTYHVYKSGRPTWEVALSGALDIMWLVPPVRMVAGAARMGTKLTAKSLKAVAKTIRVAELRAPIDMLQHPKQALKVALDPLESLVRPSKIPLESATITYHTVKIPSIESNMPGLPKVGWSREQAMEARDQLMELAMKQGKSPKMKIGADEIKLERSILEKVSPVAVSGTEDIRPFMKGAVIGLSKDPKGMGRSLFVAPNLAERFTVASSGGKVTEGGIRGGLIFKDPKLLSQLESSAKSYQGTAEVEMVFKPGVKIPKPQQVLFTRDLQGNKITLLVFGKPYTEAELAGLKIFAPQETLKQIFAKRVTVEANGNPFDELVAMDAKIAEAEQRARRATGAAAREAREQAADLAARRTRLADDIARRAQLVPDYAGVDTSGGRAFAAARRMAETAADLQTAARTEARTEQRATPATSPRLATRINSSVEPRIPADLRRPQKAEGRALLTPDARTTVTPDRVPVADEPYTPTTPETREPVRLPMMPKPPFTARGPIPPKKAQAEIGADSERRMEDPGRVQWKQGAYWIMVEPPPKEGERQRNVFYSRRPFWGVRKVKGTPEQTFSRQGKPPRQFLYEMGISHASIHSYEKPHIRWRQTSKAKRRRGKVI